MGWFDNGWGLSLIVFLPLVGAVAVLLHPQEKRGGHQGDFAWVHAGVPGAGRADGHPIRFRQRRHVPVRDDLTWIAAIDSGYHIGIDGIQLPLLVLSTFITVLAVIYSCNHWPEPHNPKAFLALILVLATGMNGTFVALDLVLFFIFFELVLLPMYFMIGIWGDRPS